MPKNRRSGKFDGEDGSQEAVGLQSEAGAGRPVQSRRVGEAGDDVAEFSVEALQSIIRLKDELLQTKDLLLQAKDSELRLLRAGMARLNAQPAVGGAALRPALSPEDLFEKFRQAYRNHRVYGFEICRLALEEDHAGAQWQLGHMFSKGRGVAKDYAMAVRLWRLAAEQGHADAQANLAYAYSSGSDVARDYAEAVRLWRHLAAQGDAIAMYNFGCLVENGQGVAQDRAEAIRLYRLAAAQGHAFAQDQLNRLGA